MIYEIKKEDFKDYLEFLTDNFELIAPVQQEIVRAKVVQANDFVVFKAPLYPAKKFFLPKREELFLFEDNKIKQDSEEIKTTVLFLNKCDANAVLRFDKLFLRDPVDINYKAHRDNSIIVEIPCEKIYDSCFCESMGLKDYYDVKLFDNKDSYLVDIKTQKGKKIFNKKFFKKNSKKIKKVKISCKKTLKLSKIKTGNKEIWEENGKKCLSCSACTIVCPTCTCFELSDELDLSCQNGIRERLWSSCQQLDFTEVAGGHAFRSSRSARVRHRILHKLKYFNDRFKEQMCVGCGRCITACPTGIDIVEIGNKLK